MIGMSKDTKKKYSEFTKSYVDDLKALVGKAFYQKPDPDDEEEEDDDEDHEDDCGFLMVESVDDEGLIKGTVVGFQGENPVLMVGPIDTITGEPCSKSEFMAALERVRTALAKKLTALQETK